MLFQHFYWNLTNQVLFLYIFAQPSLKLERPASKMHIIWYRTDICSWKLSAKVSLKHISIYFIQNSVKITCKSPSGKAMFFKVIAGVLGRLVNFKINFTCFYVIDRGSFELVLLHEICRA